MGILFFLLSILTYVSRIYGDQCGLTTGGAIIQEITTGSVWSSSGLFYDSENNKLYVAERDKPALLVIDGKTAAVQRFPISGLVRFVAAIPIKKNKDKLLGLADNKMVYLLLERDEKNNIISVKVEDNKVVESDPTMMITYSKVDKNGRLFIDIGFKGAFKTKPIIQVNGKVIQILNDQQTPLGLTKLKYPDGIGFTSNFKNMFQVDSKENIIWKYKYDIDKGTVGTGKVVFNMSTETLLEGCICSLTVTKDDELWIGLCESGTILLYNWERKQYQQFHQTPARYPIWLEMGGPDMTTLFVGTDGAYPEDTPSKGSLFAISGTGVKGQPSYRVVSGAS